jgi:hypothetical protein
LTHTERAERAKTKLIQRWAWAWKNKPPYDHQDADCENIRHHALRRELSVAFGNFGHRELRRALEARSAEPFVTART